MVNHGRSSCRHACGTCSRRSTAHRLGRAYGPDSSAAALARTLELPLDGLETDCCLTADGELVLLQEPLLEAGTTLSGWAHEHTAAEIRAGRLRRADGTPSDERPLILDELLQRGRDPSAVPRAHRRRVWAGDAMTLQVLDHAHAIAFSFADLMKYHGPGSPGGVAHAFKVLERALPLLEPDGAPERREIAVRTAFAGPGARDAFECVIRAVTEDRYDVDTSLERPDLGPTRARFVFRLAYRDRATTLTLRDGFVTREFLDLAGQDGRTPEQEAHLTRLKQEMADRVMSASAHDVYDATVEG